MGGAREKCTSHSSLICAQKKINTTDSSGKQHPNTLVILCASVWKGERKVPLENGVRSYFRWTASNNKKWNTPNENVPRLWNGAAPNGCHRISFDPPCVRVREIYFDNLTSNCHSLPTAFILFHGILTVLVAYVCCVQGSPFDRTDGLCQCESRRLGYAYLIMIEILWKMPGNRTGNSTQYAHVRWNCVGDRYNDICVTFHRNNVRPWHRHTHTHTPPNGIE